MKKKRNMIFWNYETPLTFLACCLWNFCEHFNISLGKYGPSVFGAAIGKPGKTN